jgi:hypothetical protein
VAANLHAIFQPSTLMAREIRSWQKSAQTMFLPRNTLTLIRDADLSHRALIENTKY